jgi:polyhydroxybutyrate depolymerase
VLEFHGASPNATGAGYLRSSPLARIADRAGFLDVAPQGLRQPSGNRGWNAYGPVLFPVAELPFVRELITRLESEFCVDARRIYASGISNGANMVNYLACRGLARYIAAIAPVAGPMYGQDDGPCAPPRPIPILDIHSLNDPFVPYGGIPAGQAQFPLPAVPAWLRGWARLDRCRTTAPAEHLAGGQQLHRWTHCADHAEIVAYAVQAGHAWPGTVGGTPAADAVWRFFAAHPLPASP